MAHRIEIALKRGVPDARGRAVVTQSRRFLHVPVRGCKTRDVYKIDVPLSARELRNVRSAFADPIIARAGVDRLPPPRFDWLIEIGYLPGVTDNIGRTAKCLLEDLLARTLDIGESVYTARQYFLRGSALTRDQVREIALGLLANPLIHTINLYRPEEWEQMPPDNTVPVMRLPSRASVRRYDLDVSDTELVALSKERHLALSLPEMHAIRDYFRGRDIAAERQAAGLPSGPTDVELECLAQTWSEHCKHKIFSARIRYRDDTGQEECIDSLFNTYIRGATEKVSKGIDWLVSIFDDNAGIVKFTEQVNLVCKIETHNTPSALDPYGGAITGIVGCNRDPMGTGRGAELLANTWGYCLGSPFYKGAIPSGLLHPRRIRDGVHDGVSDGGNQSGIPWARGFEFFDDRFMGKPLVFCGTLGKIPPQIYGQPSEKKEVRSGDRVVMVGGRIGKDGIHGATFSSEELHQESPAQAVQIGDPITQRLMYEFLIEARDRGWYQALTDNGAGGLSSSVGEMSCLSGGADIDLARAPLKYTGLSPWEILLSESQERMTLAVPPEQLENLLDLAQKRDVEATDLGAFTDTGRFNVRYGPQTVAALDLPFLHDGCPRMELTARWAPPRVRSPGRRRKGSRNTALRKLLAGLNLCSKAAKARTYDAEVKGLSVVKPLTGIHGEVPADATVMRVSHGTREGVLLAEGINPFFSDLDPYHMATSVVDLAVRRIVSAGGTFGRVAGLDNFCWPDPVQSEITPDGEYKLAQLVRATRGLFDVTTAYGVPCISGKDSMKNDSVRGGQKISIPPTLLFTTVGRIEDVGRTLTLPFKQPGDAVYVVGTTRDERGGSEYHRLLARQQKSPTHVGGHVPRVVPSRAAQWYQTMNAVAEMGLLRSSHTPSLGGLAVGLALAALGGDLGADIDLSLAPHEDVDDDALLFSESNSRFIVTCAPRDTARLESALADVPCARVGTVTKTRRLRIRVHDAREAIDSDIDRLREAYTKTLHEL